MLFPFLSSWGQEKDKNILQEIIRQEKLSENRAAIKGRQKVDFFQNNS